jgi:hypothetical protein
MSDIDYAQAITAGIAAELKGVVRYETNLPRANGPRLCLIQLYGVIGPPFERLGMITVRGDEDLELATNGAATSTGYRWSDSTVFPLADPDCVNNLITAIKTMVEQHNPPSIEDVAKKRLGRRRR